MHCVNGPAPSAYNAMVRVPQSDKQHRSALDGGAGGIQSSNSNMLRSSTQTLAYSTQTLAFTAQLLSTKTTTERCRASCCW